MSKRRTYEVVMGIRNAQVLLRPASAAGEAPDPDGLRNYHHLRGCQTTTLRTHDAQ